LVGAAVAGDAAAFDELITRYRRELHVHCYRMVGSFDDAEDLVQDAVARAWAGRSGFDGSARFRAWLYRIATNVCLDFLRASRRRAAVVDDRPVDDAAEPSPPSLAAMPWVQPYPDHLLDDAAVARETIELAYLAALQVLSPRPRAMVVMRYVLGWSAADTAAALGLSVPATNSALQRARGQLRARLPADRLAWPADPGAAAAESEVVRRFMDACERYDVDQMVALASEDIRLTAPPDPRTWDGRDAYAAETAEGFGPGAPGVLRCLATRANGRPAVADYLRGWDDTTFRPFALSVLRIEDGELAEVTAFAMGSFARFGLPASLPSGP
jgi:RNA polymerase sigma-70 factor (ECF subfamily)